MNWHRSVIDCSPVDISSQLCAPQSATRVPVRGNEPTIFFAMRVSPLVAATCSSVIPSMVNTLRQNGEFVPWVFAADAFAELMLANTSLDAAPVGFVQYLAINCAATKPQQIIKSTRRTVVR